MKSWNSFSIELTEKKAKRDYDGDGKIESGSKEHAGVVHNAIQRAKGKKADGQDTRKEEIEIEEGVRDDKTAERKARLEKKRGMKLDDHPEYKKEEVEQVAEADSLAAMAARREKRLAAQRKREGTTGAGHDFGHDYGMTAAQRKEKQDKEFKAFLGRGKKTKKEEVEHVDELYKGKHGQSEKEYADSRSQGGKMISGDSKGSGAEYTHGRRVKAANPGMQPDVGGKTKPKSQGKMDAGTRADLKYRKANLKKESYTVTNADKKGNTKAYQNYKAGMKGKDGKPLYKAADHMKEDNIQEVAPALAAVAGKMAAGAATKGIAAKGAGIAAKGAMRKKAVDFAAKKGGEMVGNKVTNMLQGNNEEFMPEKAESKAQQRLMGLALSVQRGDTPRSSVSPEVLKMAREMKEKDLKDFAGTKHEGLPEKVKKEEPEFSSPLVESLITENIAKQMAMKARREEQRAKSIDRKASAAQQRVGLNVKK
tara:strand:- start:764 stop:2203 length:1440 start_codon:yes stop_codon:yes gene_type:complete